MSDQDYIIPTKKNPVFIAQNSYFGNLEARTYKNNFCGNSCADTFSLSYLEGLKLLHEFIIEFPHCTEENPKCKWELFLIDGTTDKWGDRVYKKVYSITASNAKKLILNK